MTDPLSRYTLPPMGEVWSAEYRLQTWANVAAIQAAAQLDGYSDRGRARFVEGLMGLPRPTPEQVAELEATTRHDVVAFLQLWRETMPDEYARRIHNGLTSSDLVDTAVSVTLAAATDLILDAGLELADTLAAQAIRYWGVQRLGRTHGQPAELTSLGHQLARHAVAISNGIFRLREHMDDLLLFKLSGPVGTYRYTSLEQERRGARMLGDRFQSAELTSQRLPREAYARWVSDLAIIATSTEDAVLQVRLGQQFGVSEIREPFGGGQVGSSSMPHKQNPIRSETLTGLARLVRAQVVPVMEGIPSWGERDITHSSVERVALPTASTLTHYMLVSAEEIFAGLRVDDGMIDESIQAAGYLVHAASMKVQLMREGIAPKQVDWAVNRIIQRYSNSEYDFPNPAPPMRIDHVLELMKEMLDDRPKPQA